MLQNFKNSIKGTNFYLAAILFVGSWIGLSEELGTSIYTTLAGTIGLFGALRLWAKNDFHFKGKENLNRSANMWHYLGQMVIVLLPEAGNLVPAIADVVDAVVKKDTSVLLSRGMTLVVVLFYLLKPKPNETNP